MNREHDEDELDATLRDHLALELDGQLGRAERAFRDEVAVARSTYTIRPRRTLRAHAWVIGAMGAAVAASVAAMWVVPVAPQTDNPAVALTQPKGRADAASQQGDSPSPPAPDAPTPQPHWQQVEQLVNSVTVDDGLVLLDDNTPARLVREVALQQVEWVDERLGVRVQAVLPREGARLIPIDTY
jgi:hypothetical protein